MESKKECVQCHGQGYTYSVNPDGRPEPNVECPKCKGTGVEQKE